MTNGLPQPLIEDKPVLENGGQAVRVFNAADFFRVPLAYMGSIESPAALGIYIPQPEVGLVPVGVTEQFLADADTYHRHYTNTAYFKLLISDAMKRINFRADCLTILDIGSGSGNSVFPCLELFPDCRIVATDLSPNLLRILLDHVNGDPASLGRVLPVCMDATRDYYAEHAFDLVIGAAILHHLIDPGAAIKAAARALKPGGVAVFFEPFENGNSILRIAYSQILARDEEARNSPPTRQRSWLEWLRGAAPPVTTTDSELPADISAMLRATVESFAVRSGADKSAPLFQSMDDKWLFTRSYIEERARAAGFDEVLIYPIHAVERPFSHQTEVNLSLGIGASAERLPGWAWEILDYYDRLFSMELKRDLFIEACIILRKNGDKLQPAIHAAQQI